MAVIEEELEERMRLTPSEVVIRGLPVNASDALRLSPELIASYGMVVSEFVRLRPVIATSHIANAALTESMALISTLLLARDIALADEVATADIAEAQRTLLLLERMGLVDMLTSNTTYRLTIDQGIRLTDQLARFFGADLTEALGIEPTLLRTVLAGVGVDEGIGLEAEIAPMLLLNVRLGDGLDITPELVVNLLFQPTLIEGIEIDAGYIAPDGSFTTWAMNTRTGAVSEYANFTFNSFARVGNRYYGASSSGLFELLGDDDAGDDIIARVKSGYMQFGGTRLSRLKAAYIAGRGTGEMFLKIIESDDRHYLYRATMINQKSSKVHMGKGQRSRYFAFELTTVGQDFDLDTLEFVPIVVQRRV